MSDEIDWNAVPQYEPNLQGPEIALTFTQDEVDAFIRKERTAVWAEINRWKPFLHACPEWDYLIIDKGDLEFKHCHCFKPNPDERCPA